jgi:hypothetical protein
VQEEVEEEKKMDLLVQMEGVVPLICLKGTIQTVVEAVLILVEMGL